MTERTKDVTTLGCLGLARKLNKRYARTTIHAATLLALLTYRSKRGEMYPSYESLAEVCKCGRASVVRALAYWHELGVLRWTRTRNSNRYSFDTEVATKLTNAIPDGSPDDPSQGIQMDQTDSPDGSNAIPDGSFTAPDGSPDDPQRAITKSHELKEPLLEEPVKPDFCPNGKLASLTRQMADLDLIIRSSECPSDRLLEIRQRIWQERWDLLKSGQEATQPV